MTFVDPGHVLQLAILAAQLSGYDLPTLVKPPVVMELNTEQMHHLACVRDDVPLDDPCFDDIGIYHDGGDIGIDRQFLLTHPVFDEDTVIVHELTHWLQYMNAWGGTKCPHLQARENEAYRVQNLYSKKYGNGYYQTPATVCSVEVQLLK